MYRVEINSRKVIGRTAKNNQSSNLTTGMGIESSWTRHRKSSAFTAEVIRSATNFMAWSLKIPLSEGYHEEFL